MKLAAAPFPIPGVAAFIDVDLDFVISAALAPSKARPATQGLS
jgi:hypothetical protein